MNGKVRKILMVLFLGCAVFGHEATRLVGIGFLALMILLPEERISDKLPGERD